MSPEQLRGEKLDFRSDIFSVGIVLYELLAGKSPFHRPSQAETIAAILNEPQLPLQDYAPDLPENLHELVEKCLFKNKNERFQSVAEIMIELDKPDTQDFGRLRKKNRTLFFLKPILAVIFLMAVFAVFFYFNNKNPQRTLAVLPFSFEKAPTDKEYLANGLTQSIIDKLSKLSDLDIKNEYFINRSREKIIDPQTAGKELKADAVLVGTIQNIQGVFTLTIQLIRTSDGSRIDMFEQKIDDSNLIELQDAVSARIANKVKLNLTDEDKKKLAQKETTNPEAKLLFIRGRYYFARQEGDDLKNAEFCFLEATKLDPSFARAWTGLADTYSLYSVPGHKGAISPEDAVKSAKAAAKQAIEIDDTLSEPFVSLGMIKLRYDWDWNGAEDYFRAAISRDPEFPQAHLGLSNLLIIKNKYAESIEEAKKAKELSPFFVLPHLSLARSYYFQRNYEQLDKLLTESLEIFPNHKRLNYFRGLLYLSTNKRQEAIQIFEKLYQDDKIYGAAPLGLSYGRAGRKADAQKILGELEEIAKKADGDYVAPQEFAIVYLGLGEQDKAFEYLTKSCEEKYPAFPFVATDPIFDELKTDVRFETLKKCANL